MTLIFWIFKRFFLFIISDMLICHWILYYVLSHCIFIYLSLALLIMLGFDLFSGTFAQPLWMCVKVRGTRTERLKTLTTGWVGGMPVIMWMMDICMCTLSLLERNGGLVYVAHILTAYHTHPHTLFCLLNMTLSLSPTQKYKEQCQTP